MVFVSYKNVLPTEGGSLINGIVLCLTIITAFTYGFFGSILRDAERQKILNFIVFFGVWCSIVSLGLNQTGKLWQLNDVVLFFLFLCVQLGLCCINHNTIMRFYVGSTKNPAKAELVNKLCLLIYPLVFLTLIPVYIGLHQLDGKNLPVNKSKANTTIYKPLNIALVALTELLATISDLVLIRRIIIGAQYMNNPRGESVASGHASANVASSVKKRLGLSYGVIWLSVIFDILIKILIYEDYPVLFDSSCTLLTLALRAAVNLRYGTTLKEISRSIAGGSNINSASKSEPVMSRKPEGEEVVL